MTLGLWTLIGAGLGYAASRRQGLSLLPCVVTGLVIGPLAVALFWLPAQPGKLTETACPYCSNQIRTGARMCPHCRAVLSAGW